MGWIGPALTLGSAAIGPLSSLLGGGKSAEQKAQEDAVATSSKRGTQTFGQGQRALTPALNFNEKLLSGDPATVSGAIAPEANTILSQYDTARKAVAQNAPRGGGATRKMANLPFEASGKIANLTNTARRGAADSLSQLFSTLSGTAEGYQGQNVSGTNALATNALDRQKQQFTQGAALGKAFGSIFSKILSGKGGGPSIGDLQDSATPGDFAGPGDYEPSVSA